MKARLILSAVVLLLATATPPLHGDTDSRKFDFAGYLMPDASCAAATHVLIGPCPPNTPYAYVEFPQGKNVDRWVGRLVSVRGEGEPEGTCPLPLIHATRIGDNPILPPCPPPACENPPCP